MTSTSVISRDVLPEIRDGGACTDTDTNIFFPDDEKDLEAIGDAFAYCSGCPVRELCFEYAMAHEEFGIWGGTTARQRRSIKRKAKAKSKSEFKRLEIQEER